MTHAGLDLSNYQGEITPGQLQAIKAAGVEFAYVLATDGGGASGYQNPDAPQQAAALRSIGVKVGFYHFYRPAVPTFEQVTAFLIFIGTMGGSDLPTMLDSETPDAAGWDALANGMMQFALQLEAENNHARNALTGFYVNTNFYDNLPGFPWGRVVWFAEPSAKLPTKPCWIWQIAPRPEAGFSNVDPDVFVGTDAQWAQFTASPVPTAPSQPIPASPTNVGEEEVNVQAFEFVTDSNGNASPISPVPVNNIVNVIVVDVDPAVAHAYVQVPRFVGITSDNNLIFQGGAGNATYGARIYTTA
jgi:hypothetical protein